MTNAMRESGWGFFVSKKTNIYLKCKKDKNTNTSTGFHDDLPIHHASQPSTAYVPSMHLLKSNGCYKKTRARHREARYKITIPLYDPYAS